MRKASGAAAGDIRAEDAALDELMQATTIGFALRDRSVLLSSPRGSHRLPRARTQQSLLPMGKKLVATLTKKLGREPTTDEIKKAKKLLKARKQAAAEAAAVEAPTAPTVPAAAPSAQKRPAAAPAAAAAAKKPRAPKKLPQKEDPEYREPSAPSAPSAPSTPSAPCPPCPPAPDPAHPCLYRRRTLPRPASQSRP